MAKIAFYPQFIGTNREKSSNFVPMTLNTATILNYKNIAEARLEFSPKLKYVP